MQAQGERKTLKIGQDWPCEDHVTYFKCLESYMAFITYLP